MGGMLLDMPKKSKRGRGRPATGQETKAVSGRVWKEVAQALHDLSKMRRHSVSAQMGMKAEDIVLDAEEELREAGKWTPALDKLKAERRPNAD